MTAYVSAYRMSSARLIARCWSPDDAEAFRALLDRNDRHLRPFIPWMLSEPASLEVTRERLRRYRERFMANEDFRYALLDPDERLIGELILSTRSGGNSREVGYLLDEAATGRGLATEAAAMAARVAFEIGCVERLELHCSPENAPSVRVAQKLGFTLAQLHVAHSEDSEGVIRDMMIWVLTAEDYPQSPAAAQPMQAYDAAGRVMTPAAFSQA